MNIFNLARKYADLREDFDKLKMVHSQFLAEHANRLDAIEKAIAELQVMNAKDLQEFRERLDAGRKLRSSGRPFSVLQKLAELGELKRGEKQNA